MNNKNDPSKRVARPNPNANIGASGATASPPTTSAVDRLTAAQVEARLIAVDSWSKPGTQVLLKHLHRNAAKEAKATARQTADAEKTRGWQAVEQRLFGNPARLLSIDTDYGLGFSASLMDGPEISLIDLAGLVDTAELSDAVWVTTIGTL